MAFENKGPKVPWRQVGSLKESKTPGQHYITLSESLPAGAILRLEDPRESIDRLVTLGKMDSERAEEIKAKIPSYVKYNLVLPPQ